MRKICIFLALLQPGFVYAAYKPKVDESHSGFDNARIVSVEPASGGCMSGYPISCVGFGLQWSSANAESVIVTASKTGEVSSIREIGFSMDNHKVMLVPQAPTYFDTSNPYLKKSLRNFSGNLQMIRAMLTAPNVWMRFCLPEGCVEYDIKAYEAKGGTLAYRGVEAFLRKIDGTPEPVQSLPAMRSKRDDDDIP